MSIFHRYLKKSRYIDNRYRYFIKKKHEKRAKSAEKVDFFTQNVLIHIDIFLNELVDIDINIFQNLLVDIDIDIFQNLLIDIDINIDILGIDLSISISISIFFRIALSISISIFSKLSLSISISISIFFKFADISTIDINIRYFIDKSGGKKVEIG